MKSTRRLSIDDQADQTIIRYQVAPTFVRYALYLFLALAVIILVTDHAGSAISLRTAVEFTWAVMVLGLIAIVAMNSTEVSVTSQEVHIRFIPIALYAPRTIPRLEILAVHHWLHLRKGGIRYRLAIQTNLPVRIGTFDTREEARLAAEAISARLKVECREAPPNRGFDWIYLRALLGILMWLSAPLVLLLLLAILGL